MTKKNDYEDDDDKERKDLDLYSICDGFQASYLATYTLG